MASEAARKDLADGSEPLRRLHPASLLFSIGRTARVLLWPALAALVSDSDRFWAVFGLVLGVPAIGFAIFSYLTLRWSLRREELYVKRGLWFRSERHVPYARIQDVDLVQNVVHRLFGVAEVRVQTGGGAAPEATLRVLALSDVELLRATVRSYGAEPAPAVGDGRAPGPSHAAEVLVREIPSGQLVVLGLVMHRGLAIVAGGFALLAETDLFEHLLRLLPLENWIRGLSDRPESAVLAMLLLFAVGLVVFALLSVVWSLVRFGGYRLERVGDVLHLRCGLLTQVAASVPLARIQSLTIEETWLHRLFGSATLVARTAGGAVSDGDPSAALKHRFVPMLAASEVPALTGALLSGANLEGADWQPLAAGAAQRAGRRAALVVLLLTAPILAVGLLASGGYASLPLLLGVPAVALLAGVLGAGSALRTRWVRLPWGFAFRRGLFTRRTTLLPADRIQTVRTSESPFDRRHAHATLVLDAAGGDLRSSEVRARYLDAGRARALHQDLAAAAAATGVPSAGRF